MADKKHIAARKCYRQDITRSFNDISSNIGDFSLNEAQSKLARLLQVQDKVKLADEAILDGLIGATTKEEEIIDEYNSASAYHPVGNSL